MRVDQFWGSAAEEPIDVHPQRGGWSRNCPKAGDSDVSIAIDEDVRLDKHERIIKVWGEDGSYDLKVPVDGVNVVHIIDSARGSQQLISRD